MHVESWLSRAARSTPNQLAVGELSYAELLSRATALASVLGPGTRVGIDLPPGVPFAVALHACMLAGAIAVPIDLRSPEQDWPEVDHLIADLAPGDKDGAAPSQRTTHDLDAVAAIVRTSGSSGSPKEVALTYGNFLWSALGSAVALGAPPSERWLSAMPLTHVGGLSILMRSVIYGTEALVMPAWDTDRVLSTLRDPAGPTAISLVPTTLRRLVDAGLERPPSLRFALLGGAPIPPALLQEARAADIPVVPTYGLTESCSQAATAGRPLFCSPISLADDGEVLVGGPTVAPQARSGDGLLHTGDVGEFRDGLLTITGRKSSLVISGGENVSPERVEAVLERHPAIAEAAVFGEPDPQWGERVVAIVVPRDGAAIDAENVQSHCADALAPYERPKSIEVRTEPLPRTASGKLVRHRIKGT